MTGIVLYRSLANIEEDLKVDMVQREEATERIKASLREIHDRKLYKEAGYASFEAYCEHRWKLSRQSGYLYLAAARVDENVKPALPPGKTLGLKQAQAIAPLKPEQQREVVRELDLETAKVADVKAAVARKLGKPVPPVAKPPTDVVLRVATPDTANGHTNSFTPFRLFPGFQRVEVVRDGRGYSTLAIWKENGQARQEKHFHDTDTAALHWVSDWLAAHQAEGGWTDLNCQGQESVS